LPEAAAAACRDCRAKVEAYAKMGKRATMGWHKLFRHKELGWPTFTEDTATAPY